MDFRSFLKETTGKRVEGELLSTVLYSLLTSFALVGILYIIKLRFIETFITDQAIFLFFALVSFALVIPSVRHVQAYRELPCMAGMMVGMTSGMIAGFLFGFYVASTNGMFIGSVYGMTLGIIIGVWNGKCCGVMGIIEALMAGFMGGLMGAMTAYMLLNDHLRTTAVIVFVISAVIMSLLHYMIYVEMRMMQRKLRLDQFMTILASLLFAALTTWIIVFGPRGGIFAS